MKKLSLLFILSVLLCNSVFSIVNVDNLLQQQNKKKEVIIKSTTGVPVFRSPNFSPVQVFIFNDVLIINFQDAMKDMLIQVEKEDTKEIVLEKSYDVQRGNIVEIILSGRGKFQINLSSTTYEGYGSFIIDEL